MSNKAQKVGQEAHTARGKAKCCMVPRDHTPSALLLTQHILSMLNSSVKHKTVHVLHDKGSSHTAWLVPLIHPRKLRKQL